ncbi:EamA family transporter [Acinetobacter nectaris]|uniref:EamA family transporter n=1 Tax=Acinetobacter nectaris TaxID=1219382 RepID=UPI001F35E736|nr:DMT family transporter [Acinetobacter nectaris]MCF9045461.1 DMT family transporter [Acinetobacter nectaris]
MKIENQNNYSSAILLLLIAIVSIQFSGSLAKILFQTHDVLVVATMRLGISATILAIVGRLWTINWNNIQWKTIITYGMALSGMNALFYMSLKYLPLGIAVSFEFIGPLAVALFHAKQKFDFIWVGLAILGMCLLFPFNKGQLSFDVVGITYALGAGACWACYILSGQKDAGISGIHTACLGMLIGTLVVLPFALNSGNLTHVFELKSLGYFFLLAVLGSALPYALEIIVLKRIPPLIFGTLTSLEPAVAAISGFIFLHESLLISQWFALSTIIIASIGCTCSTHFAKLNLERKMRKKQKQLEQQFKKDKKKGS